jgi:hypothetical protein
MNDTNHLPTYVATGIHPALQTCKVNALSTVYHIVKAEFSLVLRRRGVVTIAFQKFGIRSNEVAGGDKHQFLPFCTHTSNDNDSDVNQFDQLTHHTNLKQKQSKCSYNKQSYIPFKKYLIEPSLSISEVVNGNYVYLHRFDG